MPDTATLDLIVLPPVADDPIFAEDLFGETSSDLEILTEVSAELPRRPGSDPHDFAALFMRHRWSFALHARRFLRDERDVDEVVQEGFLKLFLAMPELETELQALAYCRRTITNLCIDRYRADQRRPRLIDLETIPVDVLSDEDEDEVDPVVQAEDAAVVRQALAMLSPIHREALIKREVEEKSLPQVAAELDITVEQAKHLLFRARRSLRRLLVGTQVQPGVDLDLAIVLAANKARAVRAAKPTGAAVLAILLVLAGVVGLRSGGGSRRVVDVAPVGAPIGALLGDPDQPRPISPQAPVSRSTVAQHPARSALPRRPRSKPPVRARVAPILPVTPAPTHPPTSTGGSTPPIPIPIPVAIPVPPAAAAYVVSGVGGSGPVQVTDQQRSLQGSARTSSSTISTSTAVGTYSLRQAFSFAADGSLIDVSLNEAVPVGSGDAVGTLVASTSTSVETLAGGSLRLLTTGTAVPIAAVNGQAVAPRALTVDVVLAPDLVQVVSEHVHVVEALPALSDPVPSPLPAPQPSVLPGPALPLGVESPAAPTDAVVDQKPATG